MFYFLKGYNSYHYYLDSLGLLSGDVGCSGVNELRECLQIGLILPSASKWAMVALAKDPLTLSLSLRILGVIIFIFGTSTNILSNEAWVYLTSFTTFSLVFPLDHFFFLPLEECMAALAFCSLDFCSFGGMVVALPLSSLHDAAESPC